MAYCCVLPTAWLLPQLRWRPGWPSGGTAGHEGTPHQELGGSRARLGGVQAGLDRGSSSLTLMWVIGSRLYGEAITMDAGECNKAVLIRVGITLTGFIAPVVVLIRLYRIYSTCQNQSKSM